MIVEFWVSISHTEAYVAINNSTPDTNQCFLYFILLALLSRFVSITQDRFKLFKFTSHFRAQQLGQGALNWIWQRLPLWRRKIKWKITQHSKKLTFIQSCLHSPLHFIPHFRYTHSWIHKLMTGCDILKLIFHFLKSLRYYIGTQSVNKGMKPA